MGLFHFEVTPVLEFVDFSRFSSTLATAMQAYATVADACYSALDEATMEFTAEQERQLDAAYTAWTQATSALDWEEVCDAEEAMGF